MSKTINTISKPDWLKVKAFGGKKYLEVMSLIKENNLHGSELARRVRFH